MQPQTDLLDMLATLRELVLKLSGENKELRSLVNLARDEYLAENSDGVTDCVTPYDYYR